MNPARREKRGHRSPRLAVRRCKGSRITEGKVGVKASKSSPCMRPSGVVARFREAAREEQSASSAKKAQREKCQPVDKAVKLLVPSKVRLRRFRADLLDSGRRPFGQGRARTSRRPHDGSTSKRRLGH